MAVSKPRPPWVLAGDVFFQDDGTVQVASASDPQMMHTVHGASCSCADNHYKAPDGWCKHVRFVHPKLTANS